MRHSSVTLSDATTVTIMADFTERLAQADSDDDFACAEDFNQLPLVNNAGPATYALSGSVGTYNGNANISSESIFDAVIATPGYVKVVNSITWCGGFGANIIGCAPVGGTSMMVVRMGGSAEGSLWAHEYGHTVGLYHRADSKGIMNATWNGNQDEVTSTECTAFVSRAINNPFNDSGIDTAASTASSREDIKPRVFTSSDDIELPPDMTLAEFVRETYIHGTPVRLAEKFSGRTSTKLLTEMLFDSSESDHWGNIVFTLGVIGGEDAVPHIIDWLEVQSSDKMDWTAVRQSSAGMMGLGYLANRTGDSQVLSYLAQKAGSRGRSSDFERAEMDEAIADSAAIGLAMIGSAKAFDLLEELEFENDSQGLKNESLPFEELFGLHAEIQRIGIREYLTR